MRIHAGQKRGGKNKTTKTRTPLPERNLPPAAAPRHMPMPHLPMRPTQQPRRIPGKGGR
ncbi:hypothetical protein [Streptosporangium brasiliense]|uniref:Uncharacterized protein n=1 Tax=Streptosporangium brasiliense TaxID=47480 RepID=A0ABT9R2Q2_9ACTN|nr:hypothetical protein [Streptosporangium brasiliense]MDP9863089.1 hypothetical protein [Streptosporangium brasiliense]